ncbi:hypothetical protein ACOMHN_012431 [Nucella lapillus]
MFSCCWRKPRSRNSEDATDNDCRWRKGDKHRAYSRGGHSGAVKDLSGPPPVFYIDSGYSTNTDSNVDTVMTTSAAKLDPNSQLQRKSKLHNEKLPSFSALDRTKRPRMRREDAVVEADNSSVVWEPLTFETFRSSSPPLAVIAPLSEARTHLPNGSQKDLADSADCHRGSNTKSRTNGGENDICKDSQPLPKLTHRISIAKDGAVTFQCKGVINEGYCPDRDQVVSDNDGLSDQEASRTCKGSNPETQAPNSLYLPDPVHGSFSSLSSSASVFSDDESSCVESGVDPDSLSQSQTHTQVPPVKDQDFVTLRTETSTNDSSLQVPDSCYTQHRAFGENSCAARNINYTTGGETSLFNDGEKRTVLESIPETPSIVKRVPPKKPKRKNPPSNASTAASCDAIMKCLTSKEEQTVSSSSSSSSSDPKRHSDVGLRHGGDDVAEMDDVVLMPPEPFMDDHDYAEFGSFDEVNGSLV